MWFYSFKIKQRAIVFFQTNIKMKRATNFCRRPIAQVQAEEEEEEEEEEAEEDTTNNKHANNRKQQKN
jgi:hypothetical protein